MANSLQPWRPKGSASRLAPPSSLSPWIESGELVPILTDVEWVSIGAYAVYPPGRHLSAKVRAFIDFLADRYGPQPYWDKCLDRARGA